MSVRRGPVPRPPRIARFLVSRLCPARHVDFILGDLDDDWAESVESRGRLVARVRYWRLAVGSILAGRRARVAAGGRSGVTFEGLVQELSHGARRLRRQPLASMVSVLTLACAIGASAVTWSLVSEMFLHPLDVRQPERLVRLGFRDDARGPRIRYGHTYPAYRSLRDAGLMPVAATGAIGARTPLLIEGAGVEERPRSVLFASHDLLEVLGLQPSQGRFFTESEDRRGAALVAVLSDRLWRGEFDGDPGVVGQVIRLRDRPVAIVGVAPEGFDGLEVGRSPDLFMPLHAIDQIQRYEGLYGDRPPLHWVDPVARLPDGVTLGQMQERLNGLQLDPARERTYVLVDAETAAIRESSRADVRQFSGLLGATVLLLLAIGSLTVGMLLVMRTEARSGELAMCLALGASRSRLVAGVAVEGFVLAAASALLAVPVARLLFVGLRAFELPGGIRVELLDLSIDSRLLAGIAAAAVASVAVMAGLASLFGVRRQLGDVLRSRAGATPRLTRRRSRAALVTGQVAVTLVLVTGAGLFARSVTRALSLNPGIDTSRLISVSLDLEQFGYDPPRAATFVDELRARLAAHPAIASLGVQYAGRGGNVVVDGTELDPPQSVTYAAIDLHYLDTVGLRVPAGRSFTADDRAGAPPVAIVTEALARHIAGEDSPLGHRIVEAGAPLAPAEIVGVVTALRGVGSQAPLKMYRPVAQQTLPTPPPGSGVTVGRRLTVRATDDAGAAIGAVTSTVRAMDPTVRLDPMSSMQASVLDRMAPQRFGMTVMGALGAIALFLSVLGTYVLAESMATQRQREIGIRAALGAGGGRLRALLLKDTIRLVGVGLLVGFFLSWLGADTIRAFLFQVEPFDPLVTGGVAVTILVLALAVSLRPAFAATRLDLARVLRAN